jgi:osmotically-inducible protein OsmY
MASVRLTPFRAFAVALFAAGACRATTASAQYSTPTPGPATKAGSAIDRAMANVSHDVAEALLAARLRIALLEHLRSDGLGISIDVKDGAVVLTGKVSQHSSQELAEQVAASVEGVRSVKSRLELEVEQAPSASKVSRAVRRAESEVKDALLEAHVKARLIDELGSVAFAIEVEATDGVVSLAGTVPDATRRGLARDIARKTKGVVELHDLIHLK